MALRKTRRQSFFSSLEPPRGGFLRINSHIGVAAYVSQRKAVFVAIF
jgi:hypothetical protein